MKPLFWFLLASSITWINSQQLPRSIVNPFHLKESHYPRRLPFDQNQNENKEDKALVDGVLKVALALLYARLTYVAEFPTAATSYNISDQCKADSQTYYDSYIRAQNWALRMHESTGKLPEGLFTGGFSAYRSFGLFDECIDTQAPTTDNTTDGSILFNGKYCSVFFFIEEVLEEELDNSTIANQPQERGNWISIGQLLQWIRQGPKLLKPKVKDTNFLAQFLPGVDFCLPSSCSPDDFRRAISEFVGQEVIYVDDYNKTYSIVTYADDGWCHTRETVDATPNFDGPDIAVIVTLSLLAFLSLAASCHEAFRLYTERPIDAKRDSLAVRYLHCFSVINNGKKLLSTKAPPGNLGCLNGLRVFSTAWVVLGHAYGTVTYHTMYNSYQLSEIEAYRWTMQAVFNATVSVDTFFLMSGLLVAYLLLRELDRNKGRFNVLLFYVHRYLRLTPVYAIILGFLATLIVYVSNGPNWRLILYMREACRWNWWNHLLYVNNYVATSPLICMEETWYLACDMQMFLVSPLLIWPLWRWRRAGLIWVLLNIVAFTSGIIAIYIVWDLPATAFVTRPIEMTNPHWNDDYYVQMWTRFPPYLVGILLGWMLHQTRRSKVVMSKYLVTTGWALATATGLAIIYGIIPYLNEDEVPEMNSFARVSYGSLHRLAWSIAVGWLVFACVHGYGGPVNRFLSWKAFAPISRLTYVVYLIHVNYMFMWSSTLRKPIYYTDLDHVQFYLGVIFGLNLLAFGISVTVEAPLLNLEKLAFSSFLPERKRETETPTVKATDEETTVPEK